MAPQTEDDSFAEEVENRLQSIFGDEDSGGSWEEDDVEEDGEQEPLESDPGTGPSEAVDDVWEEAPSSDEIEDPLRKLKTIVLSIDWEINEEVMTGFVEQVAVLQDHYRDDKIVLVFLQLLTSLGEYIRANLGRSHPETFRVLNLLSSQLEKIAKADHLSEAEKKKILAAGLARYKKLKGRLVSAAAKSATTPAPVAAKAPVAPAAGDLQALGELIAEMKTGLTAEIQALRKEVLALKEALAEKGVAP